MIVLLFAFLLSQSGYIELYNEGQRLLEAGKVVEAEGVLEEAAALNPKSVSILHALAKVYRREKRFPEAAAQYRKILEINPKDISARGHLAELYSWMGDYDKSISTYKDALEIDPENNDLMIGMARVLRWSHRYDEAERLYNKVLQKDEENLEALKGLAKTYSMAGDYKRGIEILNEAIRLYPGDAELYKEKGTVLAWQKDYKGAISTLKRAIELSPDYADAYRTIGDVYLWMRSYQESIDSYKRAVEIEPENIENYLLLSRLYKQTGDMQLAEEFVKKALRISPSDSHALTMWRELRGLEGYQILGKTRDIVELTVFLFVLGTVFFTYKKKRRLIKRRHKLYFYFLNFVLPVLVLIILVVFLSDNRLSSLIDTSLIKELTEAVLFISLGASLLAFLWAERRTNDYSKETILAVGAHPDDIELGCSAFLMKAKDNGAKIYGLVLTRGEKGTDRNGKREKEFTEAAIFMELDGFWVMDLPDTELKNSVSRIKDIVEDKIKEVQATLVLTHTDMDLHSDHQAVFEATREAARNISILCYEDVSTPKEFIPNYYIDISGYIEDKLRLISFHKTQKDKTYMDPEVIKGRAAHRGLQANVQYAEAFRIYKLLR